MGREFHERPDWIAGLAWGRGYITPFELTRIGAYKSAKGVAFLTVNTEEDIERLHRHKVSDEKQHPPVERQVQPGPFKVFVARREQRAIDAVVDHANVLACHPHLL